MHDDYIPVTKFTSNITGQCSKYPINACLPYYANQTKGQWPFYNSNTETPKDRKTTLHKSNATLQRSQTHNNSKHNTALLACSFLNAS